MEGYNLMIIGKSGVGKSSLLNYLFNRNLAETGSGKPVTKEGFHLKSGLIDGKTVNIYDSWGIEAGKTKEWLEMFEKQIQQSKTERNVGKWMHTVLFCISAESKRIEPFEKEILKVLIREKLNPVVVVTKSDADIEGSFKREIENILRLKTVSVCSESKSVGLGKSKKVTVSSGKNELINSVLVNCIGSFKERIVVIQKAVLKQRALYGKQTISRNAINEIESASGIYTISSSNVKRISENIKERISNYDNETKDILKIQLESAELFYNENIYLSFKDNIEKSKTSLTSVILGPKPDMLSLNLTDWLDDLIPNVFVVFYPILIFKLLRYFSNENKSTVLNEITNEINNHFDNQYKMIKLPAKQKVLM